MAARGDALANSVACLPGVGPERVGQLARLNILTIKDLLWHCPRRYEDRRQFRRLVELQLGEAATVRGRVVAMGLKRFRSGRKSLFELVVDDGTARLHCRWWNLPFMQKYFAQGDEVIVFGKLSGIKPRRMDHPEAEVVEAGEDSSVHMNRIVPVYPLTEGLSQRWLRNLVWRVLPAAEAGITELYPGLGLEAELSRAGAVRLLHFPVELGDSARARERLALDELIELQLAIQQRRRKLQEAARGLACGGDNHLIKPFLQNLGFELTAAQTAVLRELRRDMAGKHPMRRLLQGDVGSGKTVVAACCALMAVESGFSVVLMAPTEILAEQHHQTFRRWFERLGIEVRLWTGAQKPEPTGNRSSETAALELPLGLGKGIDGGRSGFRAGMVIGTHALIEPSCELENLGLVVIDEQHKFGVAQRELLLRKGRYPHLLVMTATPIPRTLGLTVYGDLDLSVIKQIPGGRGRIRTFVRGSERLPKVWEFVREKLGEGRQAYVVYPRIDDAGTGTTKALLREADRLGKVLAPFPLGVLHGRLRTDEKEGLMEAFRKGEIAVLLATSVIEVGIDVPNATVMVVEDVEQFGLAQLHQLRGRIGRGSHESFCILVGHVKTPEARQRLSILAETTDGFRIAEEDLRLRGPGELLGQDQSGLPSFRFADLSRDEAVLERARLLAGRLLDRILAWQVPNL